MSLRGRATPSRRGAGTARRVALALMVAALAELTPACRCGSAPERVEPSEPAPAEERPKLVMVEPRLPPVAPRYEPAPAPTEPLPPAERPVALGGNTLLETPLDAHAARPLLVVLSGGAATCRTWALAAKESAFVLCPDFPVEIQPSEAERFTVILRGLIQAVKARFPAALAPGSIVLVGASSGLAVPLLRDTPAFFSRVFFTTEPDSPWNAAEAEQYAAQGGRGVVITCASAGCGVVAQRDVVLLGQAGVRARAESDAASAPAASLAWLVAGDPRWAFLTPAPAASPPSSPPSSSPEAPAAK